MAITRFRNSTISNRTPKYNDVLAGLPFRPIIGTATDGGNGTSVSVAFTGNNSAGAGITYTALSSPGNFTGTGTASPITVSGLTSGTAYTFQVKAGNSLGDSAYSAASNSVTPVQPTAFESIATATGTGSSNSITFSSIPSTYQSLQIRWVARNTNTGTDASISRMSVNGDTTGANYAWHELWGSGTSVSVSGSDSGLPYYGMVVRNGAASGITGVGIIDIHNYASTTQFKTIRCFSGDDRNGAGIVGMWSGLWENTNAVTSITLYAETFGSATNFTTATQFALYGIKGA